MYVFYTVRKYQYQKNLLMDEKPTTSAKFILQKLPKTISRSNDRDVPLPSPFPLPQNYRADVAAALEADQMTADTEKAFFSSIASAIFKYKKTPTTEDYIDVATVITQKYPFFKATSGKSYVSTLFNYNSFVIYMLNKNTWGVKKCGANQKQHCKQAGTTKMFDIS